ncbi:putative ABC transporter ATP-binding protein [Gordonia polyisoprenivorans NBRC 16320 = JCM 10675]|uniref:methionine ABC transporter ATP-binding protein n=1 Tax=Gordonia polyisoprenivorans TaxID=84595 RepID=UPI00023A96B4|nr:methionine ABC transporter ATP-binding protein [Gordonia polyisoprenivorans]GAB21747.1 putative ABC transporter ATP-binding protein [Gordonia polyisoprenivorans NBRC 16320 = JCM 10675]
MAPEPVPAGAARRPAAVEFVDVAKRFGKDAPAVLDGISLRIDAGEIVGIIGPSGAGKSTLARLINGLERPTSGHVLVDGRDHGGARERELNAFRTQIGMIFQQFNLFNSRTVAGNVGFALQVAGVPKSARQQRINELLEFVGIADKAKAWPSALSGGQKQRVGIARALASSPSILIADEATSALDPQTTDDTLKLLRRINSDLGTTIVVITHEMDVVREVCGKVAVLADGRLVDHGELYEVFAHPRSEVTRSLLRHAVSGVPDADTLTALRSRHSGRLVTVEVRDDAARVDLTGAVARAGGTASVIHGGIADLGGRPFGALTYEVHAPDSALDEIVDESRTATGIVVHEEVSR